MSFNLKWSANAWWRCNLTPSAISAAGICKEHNDQLHQQSHFSKAVLDGWLTWMTSRARGPVLGGKAMYNAWFDGINHNVAAHVWRKRSNPAWQDFYEKEFSWDSKIHGSLLKRTGCGQFVAQKLSESVSQSTLPPSRMDSIKYCLPLNDHHRVLKMDEMLEFKERPKKNVSCLTTLKQQKTTFVTSNW